MAELTLQGRSFVDGTASAKLLFTDVPLSFWGGINLATGEVIDHHHPLRGKDLKNSILAIPSGRGSCTGSMAILELLLCDRAPAALIFEQNEYIITTGVLVGEAMFNVSIPIVVLGPKDFIQLQEQSFVTINHNGVVQASISRPPILNTLADVSSSTTPNIELSIRDQDMLAGGYGPAAQLALQIVVKLGALQGASKLVDVVQAHIDSSVYTGPASLQFAQTLLRMGGKVAVPTTINAISVDQRRWQELGIDPKVSAEASALANAYVSMGASNSFTCAPYSLVTAPAQDENIAWGESNAVIFANSVLGARTQKNPDFMEVCVALTGRTPLIGCHLDEGRAPVICIQVKDMDTFDDSVYVLLGYAVGKLSPYGIPLVKGMEHCRPRLSDLKGFSAALGTASSTPMFHMKGVTPEVARYASAEHTLPRVQLDKSLVASCWHSLNTARDPSVQLVSLGNPHFVLEEFEALAHLCQDRKRNLHVDVIITTNRDIHRQAIQHGYVSTIEKFGASIITDTCWCMIGEPVIKHDVVNIMTNSGKYAHYAPALVLRRVHFGSLKECVEAACAGVVSKDRTYP